ncbi:hypothetical protein AB1286_28985 [Trinickia sp. NRRL B-1857]|uniref:hypothetical protein n=1 Tax=Trinickia sp. NRRL B-1857 TaxID=3162879 RepID=UPI003D2CB26F
MLTIFICCAVAVALQNSSYADVGVSEPEWFGPPVIYELSHQLSLPHVAEVRDIAKIGNFTSDGATIEIVLIGNGGRLYGATGEARKIRDGLYILSADPVDHCSLLIHVSRSRIGIEGLQADENLQRFCPSKIFWLPVKVN